MSSSPVVRVAPQEYLDRERVSDSKHEFVDGEVFAMAGGTPAHALITNNVAGELRNQLRNTPCKSFSSDLRVCVRWDRLITYPDVTVACPPLDYTDEKRDTILNPRVVVEVLSPSTEAYDRGTKARLYRMAPSIQEYLLIGQVPVDLEHGRRLSNGHWDLRIIEDIGAMIRLESIECKLAVEEVYAGLAIL